MSRTAGCLFALGLGLSLAAACGDDDVEVINTGGTGGGAGAAGRAGSGGTAGAAGTAGSAGTNSGGSAGDDGDGGTAGTGGAGNGGTAGSAGTAGTGGTGGSDEVPDAGSDAEVSDAGSTCPGSTANASSSAGNAEVIISALVFNDDNTVTVTLQGVILGGFDFGDPLLLCTGSEPEDCDDAVQGLDTVAPGAEVTITTELGAVTVEAGELALVNGLPSSPDGGNPEPIVRAYVNWGDYQSLDPENDAVDDLDTRAGEEGVWTSGESVEIGDNTVFFATGDVTTEAGFTACTP